MSTDTPPPQTRGPRPGDLVTLTIARLGDKGLGEARWTTHIGPQREERTYDVEVRKAMVGDVVEATIERRVRRTLHARVERVVTPAPGRAAPRCRHFGPREEHERGCGGCTLQALGYEAQLAAKRDLIRRAMAAQGTDPDLVAAPIGCDDPWRYRNKMELSFTDGRAHGLSLGLYPTGWRREALPLSECHLISATGAALIPAVRDWARELGLEAYDPKRNTGFLRQLTLREGKRTGDRLLELVTTQADTVRTAAGERPATAIAADFARFVHDHAGDAVTSVYWTQHVAERGQATTMQEHLLAGEPVIHEEMHLPGGRRLRFAIHPRAFFQPNPRQAEVLVATVIDRLCGAKRVVDLYCGTGTLGLCIAPFVDSVRGIELVPEAVENARANAAANGLTNATFVAGDVAAVLADPEEAAALAGLDAVVVDPPRAGLMPKAIEGLLALAPPRIVYVSCSARSLARDLAVLRHAGYVIDGVIQPVDQFPHTAHVENVVALVRGGS